MEARTISPVDRTRNMTMTVRITGRRQFAVRAWIAGRLMALTALVIGCKLKLDADLT